MTFMSDRLGFEPTLLDTNTSGSVKWTVIDFLSCCSCKAARLRSHFFLSSMSMWRKGGNTNKVEIDLV